MPYRCQKCMNTYKTLSLYNKHSGDCRAIKTEPKPRQTNTVLIRKRIEDTVGPTSSSPREMKKPRLNSDTLGSTEVEILEDGRSSVIKETGLKYLLQVVQVCPKFWDKKYSNFRADLEKFDYFLLLLRSNFKNF